MGTCEFARSDMTPCYIKDGEMALSNDQHCVGCGRFYAPVDAARGWKIITDEYEDGGVPLCEKWLEIDGDVVLRAASNAPLGTPEAERELALLRYLVDNRPGVE